MEQSKSEREPDQLEEHSLPGTNMAGKGPGDSCDTPVEQDSGTRRDDDTDADDARRPEK